MRVCCVCFNLTKQNRPSGINFFLYTKSRLYVAGCWPPVLSPPSLPPPHRQQPTRLPHLWDSPGKNTGVGSWDTTVHQLGKFKQKLLIITRAREDVKKLAAIICCWWECTIEHDSRKSFISVFKDIFTIWSSYPLQSIPLEIRENNAWMFITVLCIIIKNMETTQAFFSKLMDESTVVCH